MARTAAIWMTASAVLLVLSIGADSAGAVGYAPAPISVATDPAGNVYLSVPQSNGQVQKFSPDGKLLDRWGHFRAHGGDSVVPRDIATDAAGNVYVADGLHHRLGVFTAAGEAIGQWESASRAVAVGPAGYVYVIGYRRAVGFQVERFGSDGSPLGSWGGGEPGKSQFGEPWGIAAGPSGEVYVADTYSEKLQAFSAEGSFLRSWGEYGRDPGQLLRPYGVATDPAGDVYVADTANGRVQKFSPAGDLISVIGSYGRGPGHFIDPMSVAVDSTGNVYVADHAATYLEAGGGARVQKLAPDGRFLTEWRNAPALPARPKLSARLGRRTAKRSATFGFRSWQPDVRFQCRLVGDRVARKLGRWRPCRSPKRYRRMRPGLKLFQLRATEAGEASAAASRRWRIVRDRHGAGPRDVP